MKSLMIQKKLEELEVHIEDINLGDFDVIGEYTAKKNRHPSKDLYRNTGCFFCQCHAPESDHLHLKHEK